MVDPDSGKPDPETIPLPPSPGQNSSIYLPPQVPSDEDNGDSGADMAAHVAMDVDVDATVDQAILEDKNVTKKNSRAFDNLYCLLELISEQGSGGLVDKIIIAQDSLSNFINRLSPGAYSSLTKVDFKALDAHHIQPIGIYGSRESIVSFFQDVGVVDYDQARQLLPSTQDEDSQEILQSGLYIALSPQSNDNKLYVVYWPEKGTWKDDAPSSVRKNRITFMRYLTKIAHQIVCLFSDSESRSFVWNTESESAELADDEEEQDDSFDRMFSFEVAKTLEQEENVTTRTGFTFPLPRRLLESAISSFSEGSKNPSDAIVVLSGETTQGFLTTHFVESKLLQSNINNSFNPLLLRNILSTGKIELDSHLSFDALNILLDDGLSSRFFSFCVQAKEQKDAIDNELKAQEIQENEQSKKELLEGTKSLQDTLTSEILRRVKAIYPHCEFKSLDRLNPAEGETSLSDNFSSLVTLYPALPTEFDRLYSQVQWNKFPKTETAYWKLKEKLVTIETCLESSSELSSEKKDEITRMILAEADLSGVMPSDSSDQGVWSKISSFFTGKDSNYQQRSKKRLAHLDDSKFLLTLDNPQMYGGELSADTISKTLQAASSILEGLILKCSERLLHSAQTIQQKTCKTQIASLVGSKRQERYAAWRTSVVQDFHELQNDDSPDGRRDRRVLHIRDVADARFPYRKNLSYAPVSYRVSATEQTYSDPFLEYKIHAFELTTDHSHTLQLDPKFVPLPCLNERFSSSFRLPVNQTILHAQLLPKERLLLILDDQSGNITIFFDSFTNIGKAVKEGRNRKIIRQEKTGRNVVIAFDESKRMIALHACAKAQLYIFVFDESFASLQSWGLPLELGRWYEDGANVLQMCFVTGTEELLLVDNQMQARIFSLVTQQFRPASHTFHKPPLGIYSSPDGACFLARFDGEDPLRAYHWTTFGSNEGIELHTEPPFVSSNISLTSFIHRTSVHLIEYDMTASQCSSLVLDITKKATEFMFQEKSLSHRTDKAHTATLNNCLLDSHCDVWTRFPVLPAVQRYTKMSTHNPPAKRIICATDKNSATVASYFSAMIKNFEQKTRKPTGSELRSIIVESRSSAQLQSYFSKQANGQISEFLAGEWMVDILCFIPIHIAITRENRFIPLKDGIISAEYEKSLLGADVSTVVDSISFGWYESILQSYMATKPVKVVSSMGEQSVGKSYALNHLVDTSFAGSAMRTTEGVWMSITPTEDILLVALDFEGVHSIERSAQEDTLLVLFNTAISNLVLFRNNFALSRDITGLFQSFQSSSAVFDPAANPTLFCSTLVIIIKDVVDSDKKEIVREFSLKFQKIVQEEQESNFISRLHHGKLNIVPWPVIESKQFYTLFPAIRTQLDKQPITHGTAGNFLHTMKTLMAKLKANDWRALSQSMAAHRAHRLLSILQNALAYGFSEIEPHPDPLKNLDTDAAIDCQDTDCQLLLSDSETSPGERDAYLRKLCETWEGYHRRSETNEADWVKQLSDHVSNLVNVRVKHVQTWISENLKGFEKTSEPHASITALNRTFDATVIDIRANAELCKQPCASCQQLCLLNRRHDGRAHDCLTSHKCVHQCDFEEGHLEMGKACGFPAGHSGKHVCVVEDHLCGEPCILKDKVGCLGECTQIAGHQEHEHRCSSRTHACGMPCKLSVKKGPGIKAFECKGICAIASDIPHKDHICENRMCPIKCELCNRLCGSTEHLHALSADAVHLCGEIHPCRSLCSARGICEIDTAPQSIEATFTGRHETFQYTKYSQVAKRLPCVIAIPAMERSHVGKHCHSTDAAPFHFCETQCLYCGYYCTLPRGHSQQEHETSHGSMSKTRWAIEDPDAVVELNGRKFGSEDDGAPMMCNLVCQDMGRHVHIDFCRADADEGCTGPDVDHIQARLNPDPGRSKDWITHKLYWQRSGFKDPYSRDDRENFGKCDAMCPGPEHAATTAAPAQPSYCTLPLFHAPHNGANARNSLGYTSQDGHHFSCKNPAVMQQAFHVIFVIDRSGSMGSTDRRPLPGTPVTRQISAQHNDRLGAVYSSLYSFWMSRLAAVSGGPGQQAIVRRDAYSVILFDHSIVNCVANDFTSSPDQLLGMILPYTSAGGTSYNLAVHAAQTMMQQHWSTERTPVVIFLSDGECGIRDEEMQTLCRTAVSLGKPLSFHGVSFGSNNDTLRRMVQIARQVESAVPRDPLLPQTAVVESSFAEALDTVRLAETFLGIAESLKKPRGALFT